MLLPERGPPGPHHDHERAWRPALPEDDDAPLEWRAPAKEIVMTYTVMGSCHKTGRLGIGIATFSITVGRYCRGVRAMAGVTISQAFANERNNQLALRLLAQGFTAGSVLAQLTSNDPYFDYRQIRVIDRTGTAVAPTGPRTPRSARHLAGHEFLAFRHRLVRPGGALPPP